MIATATPNLEEEEIPNTSNSSSFERAESLEFNGVTVRYNPKVQRMQTSHGRFTHSNGYLPNVDI